jgi:hypothetical protein
MLKYATKHHINVTVSSGVSTKICDKNVGGWMDGLSVGSSTPARGPQDGPNVHHGLSLMSQSLIFCIRPGFMDETIFVLHVFGLR